MKRNNKYFNVKNGKTIGVSANGNYSFNVESGGVIPPVADFTVNNAAPNRYQNIQFTDTSTGNPTSWLWDFGDGQTSTDQNPIHSYEYGDEDYTVTLTVTNSVDTDTETKTNYISLGAVTFDTLMRRTNDDFYIPANTPGYTFNYSVTGAGALITGRTGNYTYVKTAASTNTFWKIRIGGKYPTFDSTNTFMPNNRVSGLYRWGTIKWESMANFFYGNTSITGNGYYTGEDVPDLRLVTSMENMFRNTNMKGIYNFSEWDVSTITNMQRVFHTASVMAEEVDWSDPVRGSINATHINGIVYNSAITSIKLQAGALISAGNAFDGAASLTELILIDMSVSFNISTTALTGAAIDALADSVADRTGKSKPTITMTQAQLDSCDHDKWLDKNWATIPPYQTTTPGTIPFIIKVNSGSDSQFTIPTEGTGYNYKITTSNGQTFTGVTGNRKITFPAANTNYDISITGTFPRIHFNNGVEKLKLREIKQWGNIKWSSMHRAFYGCQNMIGTYTDVPDTANVTSFASMFSGCGLFNSPLNNMDVSNATLLTSMFNGARAFNQPLNNWNTSKVTDTGRMFELAIKFNQNISSWNTSNVTHTNYMFKNAYVFNQPLNSWNTSKVIQMLQMFRDASAFNQPLNNWNTKNVVVMGAMFYDATAFNQNISGWNVANVTNWNNFRLGSPLTNTNTPPKFR